MTFISKNDRGKKILRNAVVLGAIASISNLITTQDLSAQNLYAGLLTGVLVALVEIKHAYNILQTPTQNKKAQSTFFLS